MKKIYVFPECSEKLEALLKKPGFEVLREFSEDADFVISVGGDGTFLHACKAINFAPVPIVGINTGHLGYFTEIMPDQLDKLHDIFSNGNYSVQEYRVINTLVKTDNDEFYITPALNDIQVRHWGSTMVHLKICVGNNLIEHFSGDGVLIASSAGSTAYNYSLGGSIIDPRISLLQLTPIAPANNISYRCFTSSILLPPEQEIVIETQNDNEVVVIADGVNTNVQNIRRVTLSLSDRAIKIVRLPDYDFWGKVKSKFL